MKELLKITDLHASVNGTEILKGLSLTINYGEVHAIMGQNGAGKSTLGAILTGNPAYEVTSGSIVYKNQDLLSMEPEIRAREGLFLSFQYPIEIPGVSMNNFMLAAINAKREHLKQEKMSASDFLTLMKEKRAFVELDSKFV